MTTYSPLQVREKNPPDYIQAKQALVCKRPMLKAFLHRIPLTELETTRRRHSSALFTGGSLDVGLEKNVSKFYYSHSCITVLSITALTESYQRPRGVTLRIRSYLCSYIAPLSRNPVPPDICNRDGLIV